MHVPNKDAVIGRSSRGQGSASSCTGPKPKLCLSLPVEPPITCEALRGLCDCLINTFTLAEKLLLLCLPGHFSHIIDSHIFTTELARMVRADDPEVVWDEPNEVDDNWA